MELLFYGGIAAMAAAVIFGIVAFVTFRLRRTRLRHLLEMEYGAWDEKT
ncbi:MAG: hypothetical protein K2O18_08730 [Oscillospiraceae bacterium]|nr:hypothetical protein [Oscillospiraceae bacterium]